MVGETSHILFNIIARKSSDLWFWTLSIKNKNFSLDFLGKIPFSNLKARVGGLTSLGLCSEEKNRFLAGSLLLSCSLKTSNALFV